MTELADEELKDSMPDFPPVSDSPAAAAPERPEIQPAAPVQAAPDTTYYAPAPTSAQAAPVPTADVDDSSDAGNGSNAALTLVRGLKGKAIRVSRRGSRDRFAFYATKALVSRKAGEPYKARAYVRTTSPGMYLCLRVQEYGGGVPRTTERCAPARSGWRRVALKGRAAGKGHKLVLSIHVMAAAGGTSFDVDGFGLAQS